MTWIAAVFLVLAFLVLLQFLRVPARVGEIQRVGREALRTIRDTALRDADKEKAMRAGSLRLFTLFLAIAAATVFALLVPAGVVWLLAAADLVVFEEVLDRTLSWQVLAFASIAGLFLMRLLSRRPA